MDKIPVKFHFCHAHVRNDPEETDAQTYDAQKGDSEETDQQVKIPDPVAFHQLFALLHDLLAGDVYKRQDVISNGSVIHVYDNQFMILSLIHI